MPTSTKWQRQPFLPPEEVGYWFEHLKNIRRNHRRAQKAAQTRWQKRGTRYFCSCGEEYLTITEDIVQWIGRDECDSWYHCECVGVDPDSIPDRFVCARCSDR